MRKYEPKEARLGLAREIAADSIVLLENKDRVLPLQKGSQVALFGRGQIETQIGGGGSGASFSEDATDILEECIRAGLQPVEELAGFYRQFVAQAAEEAGKQKGEFDFSKLGDLVASGLIYEIFGRYTAPAIEAGVEEGLLARAAEKTDTALLVISRASGGEECDRRREDDYYLLESERKLAEAVCSRFAKVIVVLNINGVVDTAWIRQYPSIKAVLFLGTPGEQGAAALADILVGEVSPSGRLSATFALSYEDYPTAKDFSFNKDEPEHILEYKHYGLDAEANRDKHARRSNGVDTEGGYDPRESIAFEKKPVSVYREGIYMGYRYFDTFEKDVMYPFGFGLSYADFEQKVEHIYRVSERCPGQEVASVSGECPDHADMEVAVTVTNCSETAGKDVVQVYASLPAGRLEQPYKKLIGFGKTHLLQPGESERVVIRIPLMELASYDEAKAAYVLEAGEYFLRTGSTGSQTHIAGKIVVSEEIVVVRYENRLSLQECNRGKIDFLSSRDVEWKEQYAGEETERTQAPLLFELTEADGRAMEAGLQTMKKQVFPKQGEVSKKQQETGIWQFSDVKNGHISLPEFVAQMSVEELAVLANGYGPGLPFGGMGGKYPSTIQYEDGTDIAVSSHPTGNPGYVSPSLPKYGIPSVFYKDGPAGVRMTAWPTGMVVACSFNPEMAYEFGSACGWEAESQEVDSWLAPAMNLHRNPLGGRNFEYFSEDPYLAGVCGLMVARGAEENNHVTTCPKHYALNEQETYRRGSLKKLFDAVDSIVEERAARELYLKPFEMVVRGSQVKTIMSSFNKINGTFAGGSKDLCMHILREEWGFEGVVVTDWGDMDIVVDGADAVAAGNDVVMPGGPPVIAQVLAGYQDGDCTLEELRTAAEHLLTFVLAQR